ncbi:MAG TPA: hypothetical protein VNH83_25490 [Bryobacteraceae bacterium]|jgi:hypothetical protein|nr:hypothetical protein [Bryobacteraceae bacterium]
MRTTLTLDPDVALKLKSRVAEQKAPFKEIVNAALRRGLSQVSPSKPKKRFRVQSHSLGLKPGIDAGRFNQLLDELEVEAFAARARVNKKRR